MKGQVLKRRWKNKAGEWVEASTFTICYYQEGRHRTQGGFTSKRQAERVLAERVYKIHRGEYQEIKPIGFSKFADKWLSDHAEPRVKPSTFEGYKNMVDVHLKPYFESRKLTSISPHDVEAYLTQKRNEGKLSARSIGYHLVLLKMMFKRAQIWGYAGLNPAQHIAKPRAERKEIEFLDPTELRLFLEKVEPKAYPLILTLAMTGLRLGESLALCWGDVSFATNTLHVRRSVTRGKISEPKSSHSIRAVAMPPTLISVLKRHKLASTPSQEDFCFPSEAGKPLDPHNVYARLFIPALRRAKLRHVTIHSLRHSYASFLIAQGENLKFVQSQLGHSSIQVTCDRYGHLLPETRDGAARRLEETIFGKVTMPEALVQ